MVCAVTLAQGDSLITNVIRAIGKDLDTDFSSVLRFGRYSNETKNENMDNAQMR